MVIDAHTHAWGPPSPAHPWVNASIVEAVDRFSVDAVYTAEKLLADMDRVGVDAAVVVGYPIVEWTDNWYTLRCAADHDRLYGVVLLDPLADDAVERAGEALSADGVVGMRIASGHQHGAMWRPAPTDEPATWLRDAVDRASFWEVARREDSVVTIAAGDDHLDQVRDLVETYSDLTYLFDGYGPLSAGASAEQFEVLAGFADFDAVGVKASHTPFLSDEGFPYGDVHDVLRWLLDAFGPERVAWGSDFPNVTQHPDDVTYGEARNWLSHVDGLSSRDRTYLEGRAFEAMVEKALD